MGLDGAGTKALTEKDINLLFDPNNVNGSGTIIASTANVLTQVCRLNDQFLNDVQSTRFNSAKPSTISIEDYMYRIVKYAPCSRHCFVLALVYIDRLVQSSPRLRVTSLNIHRLLVTAVMVASKYFDDKYYNNVYFAKVGGIPSRQMNALEMELCFRMNWECYVLPEVFAMYVQELLRRAAKDSIRSQSQSVDPDKLLRRLRRVSISEDKCHRIHTRRRNSAELRELLRDSPNPNPSILSSTTAGAMQSGVNSAANTAPNTPYIGGEHDEEEEESDEHELADVSMRPDPQTDDEDEYKCEESQTRTPVQQLPHKSPLGVGSSSISSPCFISNTRSSVSDQDITPIPSMLGSRRESTSVIDGDNGTCAPAMVEGSRRSITSPRSYNSRGSSMMDKSKESRSPSVRFTEDSPVIRYYDKPRDIHDFGDVLNTKLVDRCKNGVETDEQNLALGEDENETLDVGGDLYVDSDADVDEEQTEKFVRAHFGDNDHSPAVLPSYVFNVGSRIELEQDGLIDSER
eukprot:CFRG2879T1